ncbi:cytochrome P450 [Actibacterium ureilyticum]|uniref:cytochrome P450 n=1 Tax=Actibacterium ureilyticum TaxID=1590614 RepID=UPI000BAB204E|nr:cytochrome P450 [Actibacterium ureilyticum]
MSLPPKPAARPEKVSFWRYLRLFRADILSAQPEKLYRAKMAEYRTPFFRSFLINEPDLIRQVLRERPMEFPKSNRVGEGLRPLLGNSVFLTNGATWQRQRRIIGPAFEGGRLRDTFPAMRDAARAAVARLYEGTIEIEAEASHAAADVIFRTLFSIPIQHALAAEVFDAFRTYQRSQPILNLAAFLPLPRWLPRGHRRQTRAAARLIRDRITRLTADRMDAIRAGTAPDDLATKIMTMRDPETGACFDTEEMVDQVAIFFLAGHETSAAALSWALYLLATHPDIQDRAAAEVTALGTEITFSDLSRLRLTRDVFREALRLYPPVPMMVRAAGVETPFRNRSVRRGDQIVISPWHLHRNDRYWANPDAFDPDRYTTQAGQQAARQAYYPFSAGPRVCPGAGFAMLEGTLILAEILRAFHLAPVDGETPIPVAYLTVRTRDGLFLTLRRRAK